VWKLLGHQTGAVGIKEVAICGKCRESL
jgi:hypothetical protein